MIDDSPGSRKLRSITFTLINVVDSLGATRSITIHIQAFSAPLSPISYSTESGDRQFRKNSNMVHPNMLRHMMMDGIYMVSIFQN